LDAARPYLGHVRHAFLIGEAAEPFARALQGTVPATVSGDLASALAAAREAALADGATEGGGGVVLLSPACASFDQFANFEARGLAFRELVQALPGARAEPDEISVAPKKTKKKGGRP
jgi:UDP-N-acetylmuramoylalanine--D-glutamate ligase